LIRLWTTLQPSIHGVAVQRRLKQPILISHHAIAALTMPVSKTDMIYLDPPDVPMLACSSRPLCAK
jgi:hypothetical protein